MMERDTDRRPDQPQHANLHQIVVVVACAAGEARRDWGHEAEVLFNALVAALNSCCVR